MVFVVVGRAEAVLVRVVRVEGVAEGGTAASCAVATGVVKGERVGGVKVREGGVGGMVGWETGMQTVGGALTLVNLRQEVLGGNKRGEVAGGGASMSKRVQGMRVTVERVGVNLVKLGCKSVVEE